MGRLCPLTEAGLPAEPAVGVVHLGLGAFFRAHGAIYLAEAMAASGGDWRVLGVSLRSPAIRDALMPQGCAYTALELAPGGPVARRVTSVARVLVAPEDPSAVLEAMAAPGVRIVSLTVTEKGYCHEPATGRLKLDHPDIVHDLTGALPVSAPGYLVRALQMRRAAGLRPFTVLTCDNLPGNGPLLRGLVLEMAGRIDPALATWIASECRFPATMVDRIVPATTEADLDTVARLTGKRDAAPVVHEPFRQWVVEDDFVDGARPDLGAVGVQLVDDVAPFELMKLRMLNGTHSALAYLGYLSGHDTIADCLADPALRGFVRRLWRAEIIPALTPPPGVDLMAYAEALEARYANPAIRHRTWQIAMDGSQKLPQRVLGTLATNLTEGRPSPGLILTLAAWMAYVRGHDLKGQPIDLRDPLAPRLRDLAAQGPAALLSLREVFPESLAQAIARDVTAAHAALLTRGPRALMESLR